jgi:hypothetical protein
MGQAAYSGPVEMLAADDATVVDAVSEEKGCRHLSQCTGGVAWGEDTVSGIVIFEIAPYVGYTGEWFEIGASDAAALIAGGATMPAYEHFTFPGNFGAIRHRLAEVIVGGSVQTYHDGYCN